MTVYQRWKRRSLPAVAAVIAIAFCAIGVVPARAQIRYATGQDVVPVFEGWERLPDGSYDMVFGYMNRNYEQQIDLPVGADNMLEPGVPDQGQPTHFYPRRQQFVFKVRVPKDWGKKDLIWTVRVNGKTEKAYASLLPFWELGGFVYQENRGSGAPIGDTPEPNVAPSITLTGPAAVTTAVNAPLALDVQVTDDGHPVPRKRSGGTPTVRRDSDGAVITATGTPGPGSSGVRRENPLTQAIVRLDPGVDLGVTWVVYRGVNAGVTFEPQRAAVVNGRVQTQVRFSKAGRYTLRAYADDGILVTPVDVIVDVKGQP